MREYRQGAKTLLMNKIAAKIGIKPREGSSSVRYFTGEDYRKILDHIEELEIRIRELEGG